METRQDTYTDDDAAKHGQGVRTQVIARRAELEARLAELQNSEQQGAPAVEAIELALATLTELLPGDLDHITPSIALPLTHWLESNKHLGLIDHDEKLGVSKTKQRRSKKRSS